MCYDDAMERIVHRSKSHDEAARWDRRQREEMKVMERMAAATELKRRVFGDNPPDIRACPRKK